ncbi:hypothetical protein BGX31_010538 [Mortierella sp. GBA43]|nr:hypothetical protein BGX31_010538 [Mortierella sp. GBA43]
MVFSNIVPSCLATLSLQQALELTHVYLENAYKMKDQRIAMVLCHEAEVALSQVKKANRKYPVHPDDTVYQTLRAQVAMAYIDLGKYLDRRGYPNEAIALCKKAEKWGGNVNDPGRLAQLSRPVETEESYGEKQTTGTVHTTTVSKIKHRPTMASIPAYIFAENVRPSAANHQLPQPDERLSSTPQLVFCLWMLQVTHSHDDILQQDAQQWLMAVRKDTDEQQRLHALAKEVIRAFMKDELKDAKAVAEVVCLAPVLSKDAFHDLLREFYSGIDHSGLLNFHPLEGIAQLIQGANPSHLSADDLVKILELLSSRLRVTHQQSPQHMRQLTLAVSHVLDAMADTKVTGLDRERLHEPLSMYLGDLKKSKDPFLVYQAAYAYQALLCVPDNETAWQAATRRTGKVIKGVAGLVSAVKGFDLERFIDGLTDIQQGLGGVSKVIDVVKSGYEGVSSMAKDGQGFVECLKEGLSFERRREWYAALRGADTLIRNGELATFKKLVCGAPCRYDPAFQWGVCQRLGVMAASPLWDAEIRRSAIAFLGEIYQEDDMWGDHSSVKQWILNILMQLASTDSSTSTGGVSQIHTIVADSLLQELQDCSDTKKQDLYQECRRHGPIDYPLKMSLPELGSPSLLDRVQNRPDVEGSIRVLRKQRTKGHGNNVFIPPQAKPNSQASDDARFQLMDKVKAFLNSDQQVFLLLGDSGAGKSTFSRELEIDLWREYENKTERIPLHINLPAIEKPEHDMIAKQLRKAEFTEPQIREMKHHRRFILICDGYDESQQTQNLYMTNKLNQDGEWSAQMVISCRSEYLGSGYRDQFQPGRDRNTQSDSSLFQEAVVAPFTMDQVQAYIHQYVIIHQPLWGVEDYKQALDLIPSLKDLVRNPFLMTLSLEVLPRMVDPGQHLSATHVTRVMLYDHFIEQWLERGKKRLGEKAMKSQTKDAFERLSAGGFTISGIEYLKKLSLAIYKRQGGNPVIEYSPLIDKESWKEEFFKEKDMQLLLEACPMTRNGNQYRFIHRSLLEYGLARAVFDPRDRKNKEASGPALGRRASTSSTLSFEMDDTSHDDPTAMDQDPNPHSPLVWRSFVNDHSFMQFLEERVQQEPIFKQQLLAYIEHSKSDKKWRKAASNAMTILVRSGEQFHNTDLRGIQIPGADLSYGVFESTQLQRADLRKTDLRGVWMRDADLTEAQMGGVKFGELPYLSGETPMRSCAYSPDGELFAVGHGGVISVYTTSDWEKVQTLMGHQNTVISVTFSMDGAHIASTSHDCTARLWDVKTEDCHYIFIHTAMVYCAAYSPRGRVIAIGCEDETLRLRDLTTGQCIRSLSGHVGGISCTAYSPDGDILATGSADQTVRLWNADTGECTHIMIGHSGYVSGIAFSPRANVMASGSYDKTVRLWDTETGLSCNVLEHSDDVNGIAYSPKGDQLASASEDKTVRVWDTESGTNRYIFTGHVSRVWCVAYPPQGNHIASGGNDRTVRLWDVSVGVSRMVSSNHNTGTFRVQFSPNGDQLVCYESGNMMRILDVDTGNCQRILSGHTSKVKGSAYSSQGDKIVSCESLTIRLWDAVSGTCQRVLYECGTSVAFSPQGNMIAYSFYGMSVRLLDLGTGDTTSLFRGGMTRDPKIVFSPDGNILAVVRDDTTLIWDIATSALLHTLDCGSEVSDVIFSPQGHQLATASYGQVRIWDVQTWNCQMILIGHTEGDVFIAYPLDGKSLVSGGGGTVRLWDVASGQCRAVVSGIPDTIKGITQRHSSKDIYVITGSVEGSIAGWKIVEEENEYRSVRKWFMTSGALVVSKSSIQGVLGLSQLSKQLLKQRGAEGEPDSQLLRASSKVIAMASVVSRLHRPALDIETPDVSQKVYHPVDQVEPQVKPTSDA